MDDVVIGYALRTLPVYRRATQHADGRIISRLRRRVSLSQIDINLHMNQGEYPRMMELGRVDWLVRSQAWTRWKKDGFNPMAAEQTVTYRYELKPLARYTIDTRAVAVDGRFLTTESHFLVGDKVHTKGIVKVMFVGPDGVMNSEQVHEIADWLITDPLPVENWRTTEPA